MFCTNYQSDILIFLYFSTAQIATLKIISFTSPSNLCEDRNEKAQPFQEKMELRMCC